MTAAPCASQSRQSVNLYYLSSFLIAYALARCRFRGDYINLLHSFQDRKFRSVLVGKLAWLEEHFEIDIGFPENNDRDIALRSRNVYDRSVSSNEDGSAPFTVYEPWYSDEPGDINLQKPKEVWDAVKHIIPAISSVSIQEPRNLASWDRDDMGCLVYVMLGIGLALRRRHLSDQTIRGLNLGLAVQIGFFAVDNGPKARHILRLLPPVPTEKGFDSALMKTLANVDCNMAAMRTQFEGFLKENREKCSLEGSSAQGSAGEQISSAMDNASGGKTSVAKGDRENDTWFDSRTDCVHLDNDCNECT
ncbi:hypothetical protein NKR23_g12496 [Pleurostoma richardsiae]|uniref:Uncharacterized protein n=1 Tax=Pleurostoma richardsiae TaxID=41990 RepID=A0AA38RE10_9PEZI|nr:hypothetical protein NKR23_g12496 [Pleurostoma richardsiae]